MAHGKEVDDLVMINSGLGIIGEEGEEGYCIHTHSSVHLHVRHSHKDTVTKARRQIKMCHALKIAQTNFCIEMQTSNN